VTSGPRRCAVSVVIPYFQKADTVERALVSIAGQTVLPAEVIVVDDEGSPSSQEVLRVLHDRAWPFPIRLMAMPGNGGPAAARNVGWENTLPGSRYVAFLDADDFWLPRKLEIQATWMDLHPHIHWTAHRVKRSAAAPAPPLDTAPAIRAKRITLLQLLVRNPVATPSVMIARNSGSRFRDSWRYCEDLMLWADLTTGGMCGMMLDIRLAVLGRPPRSLGGLTADIKAMHTAERQVLETLRNEHKVSPLSALLLRAISWLRYRRRLIMAC
jgi:glycosyltransferase involved in cell wall biosynthesis